MSSQKPIQAEDLLANRASLLLDLGEVTYQRIKAAQKLESLEIQHHEILEAIEKVEKDLKNLDEDLET